MPTPTLTPKIFEDVARSMLDMPGERKDDDKTFRSFFGAPMSIVSMLWNMILAKKGGVLERGAEPKHLLWALVFLKCYATTPVLLRICQWPAENTYRKWVWYFIDRISELKEDVIKLDNRFDGYDGETSCLLSVDALDCMINEPWSFDKKWYSQKFNGPGVKYELGVCIKTARICWMNGPFPASKADSTICIEGLLTLLADDEGVEIDGGYQGSNKFKNSVTATSRADRKTKSVVRGRHENINGRLKIFDILNIPFRHLNPRNKMMDKHGKSFEAIVVITELKFENGEGLYDVPYDVSYE